jgi:hypothetical protein
MTDLEEQRLKEDWVNQINEHPYQHAVLTGLAFGAFITTGAIIVTTMMSTTMWFSRVDDNPFVPILIKCLILGATLWGLICLFPYTHKRLRWEFHKCPPAPKNLFMMMIMSGLFIVTVIWTVWLWRYIDTQIQI